MVRYAYMREQRYILPTWCICGKRISRGAWPRDVSWFFLLHSSLNSSDDMKPSYQRNTYLNIVSDIRIKYSRILSLHHISFFSSKLHMHFFFSYPRYVSRNDTSDLSLSTLITLSPSSTPSFIQLEVLSKP